MVFPMDDAMTLHDHKPDRAGAVRVVVRGLEIYGGKFRHERGNEGDLFARRKQTFLIRGLSSREADLMMLCFPQGLFPCYKEPHDSP